MLRRNRRALTPEEAERLQRQGTPGSDAASAKPSLLSRLKLRRSAGESRTTVAPAERQASSPVEAPPTLTPARLPDVQKPPPPPPPPPLAVPVQDAPPRRTKPAPTAARRPVAAPRPQEPMPNRKKPKRPINTAEDVRLRYSQEPPA